MPAGAGLVFDMRAVAAAMSGNTPPVGEGLYRRAEAYFKLADPIIDDLIRQLKQPIETAPHPCYEPPPIREQLDSRLHLQLARAGEEAFVQ